jgi:hypothetical protein
MKTYVLLLGFALSACAAKPTTLVKIQTVTPTVPADMLICAPDPVPDATSDADVSVYIWNLWAAGQDCRLHLEAIKAALGK